MRIVAIDALTSAFVAPVVNRRKIGSGRTRVLESCMAAHAKSTFFIQWQVLFLIGVAL